MTNKEFCTGCKTIQPNSKGEYFDCGWWMCFKCRKKLEKKGLLEVKKNARI